MTVGPLLTLWSVRAACGLYVLGAAAWLIRKHAWARLAWTVAFLFYLSHVVAAFSYYHHWSHQAAYQETARQTGELFGIHWGGGLYFNYVFTAVWAADVFWMWRNAGAYRRRPKWIAVTIHAFLAFMFVNGAIVFGSGWVRWLGVTAAVVLGIVWRRGARR